MKRRFFCLLVGVLVLLLISASSLAAEAKSLVIAAGIAHSLAIRPDGSLWAWGSNSSGQLGLGDTTRRLNPTRVGSFSDWVAVAAGGSHSLGIRADGSLWAWGSNSSGQLGLGEGPSNRLEPEEVGGPYWIAVAAGGSHSLGIVGPNFDLYAWGNNSFGQLGLGDTANRITPWPVDITGVEPPKPPWIAVVAGSYHSLAKREVWFAMGGNWVGQLGMGDTADRLTLTQMPHPSDFEEVDAGYAHSLGRKANGSLWAWGWNSSGQLGLGDTTNRLTPTQLDTGASIWVAVSAGEEFGLGIRNIGDTWSWGGNTEGQLGLGDTVYRQEPTPTTPYPTSRDWMTISGGWRHSLGVRNDGSLWAWGSNSSGQLGLGDTTNRLTPTLVRFPLAMPCLPLLLLD